MAQMPPTERLQIKRFALLQGCPSSTVVLVIILIVDGIERTSVDPPVGGEEIRGHSRVKTCPARQNSRPLAVLVILLLLNHNSNSCPTWTALPLYSSTSTPPSKQARSSLSLSTVPRYPSDSIARQLAFIQDRLFPNLNLHLVVTDLLPVGQLIAGIHSQPERLHRPTTASTPTE